MPFDHLFGDHDLLDAFQRRQLEHGVEQDRFHDRAQAARAGLAVDGALGDRRQRVLVEGQVDVLHLEQPLVLLDQRVLRLGQDLDQRRLVEVLERRQHRQAADEFRDQAELQQILRLDLAEQLADAAVLRRRCTLAPKPIEVLRPRSEMILSRPAKAPPQMNRMLVGVDLQEFLLRMLAAALRRHRGDGAFHDLQQRLLHALARHVAGDRGIVRLAGDLVDLVDVDDAALGALDIVVGGLQQLQDDVLDVLADIAGLGQRRRVGHGEGHVEDAGQRLREQRLAAAGRADQQDVRLRQLDVVVLAGMREPLVVVVDGDRQHALGVGAGRSHSRRAPCRSPAGSARRRATSPSRSCSPRG